MKKAIAIALIFVTLAIIGCTAIKTTKKNFYALSTVVVKVDRENDIVTFEDFNGNMWEIEGCEDWEVNDIGALLMNNNGTENIYDDEIVQAHYNGWVD